VQIHRLGCACSSSGHGKGERPRAAELPHTSWRTSTIAFRLARLITRMYFTDSASVPSALVAPGYNLALGAVTLATVVLGVGPGLARRLLTLAPGQ
jgi:hypothetical protein